MEQSDHPESSRRMVPLAPAPMRGVPAFQSRPPSSPRQPRKRTVVTAACSACRERKTKCSAERPRCAECNKRDTTCRYETTGTETHSQALKRKFGQLQSQSSAYEELFNIIRSRPDSVASDIFNRIRQGADVQTILRHVQDGDLLLQLSLRPDTHYQYTLPCQADLLSFFKHPDNPYIEGALYEYTFGEQAFQKQSQPFLDGSRDQKNAYHIPYHGAEMVDARVDAVKLSRWTTVSTDDEFLRKLLQIFFLFCYPFYPVLHKDIFLEDMLAGRSRYCSSLLVNAILATACHGYTPIENRSEFWNPQNPGYKFLAEARRLWELEDGKCDSTTIQAAVVLGMTYFVNGMDKVGWFFWNEAVLRAEEAQLFDKPTHAKSEKALAVQTTTAWGVFGTQALFSFYFIRPPLLRSPPRVPLPEPSNAAEYFGEIWIKYPLAKDLVPLHMGYTILATSELRCLNNEIALAAFAGHKEGDGISFGQATMFRGHLMRWLQNLPEPLSPSNVALPCHLLFHMQFHNLVTMTFKPLVLVEVGPGPPPPPSNVDWSPQHLIDASQACLYTLIYLFYRRHGFEAYYVFLVQVLTHSGFDALSKITKEDTDAATRDTARSTLLLSAKGLKDQGRNYFLAEVVYRMLRERMEPEDTERLKDWAQIDNGHGWQKSMAEQVHGDWPVNMIAITEDPEEHRLNTLVRRMSNASIGSRSSSTTPERS